MFRTALTRLALTMMCTWCCLPLSATAAVDVFLDFDEQWPINLAQAAMDAGADPFTAADVAAIEAVIEKRFITTLAPFDVTVTLSDPGGSRERVHFGAQTAADTLLGQSTLNFLNTSPNISRVFAANFDFILEPTEPRPTQIGEISTALAGTALHELGHSFGVRHNAAYGDPRITPDNYANTQSFQNENLMATGLTGLNEGQREQTRDFSQWSLVLMEAAVNLTPDLLENLVEAFSDAGATTESAMPISLTPLAISQTDAALVYGELETEDDVDWFAFDVEEGMQLTAEIYSQSLFSVIDDFDSQLRLYDSDGLTVLGANDDIWYDGDTFDGGTMRETDSFLLNVPFPNAGTYYLEVSSNGTVTDPDAAGIYQLVFAASEIVPEPTGTALALMSVLMLCGRRR